MLIEHYTFQAAYGTAAALAACSIPFFVATERRLLSRPFVIIRQEVPCSS